MTNFKKKIILNDNGIINYSFYPSRLGYEEDIYISRAFIKDDVVKNISFSKNQDISFLGTTNKEEEILEFVFNIFDPFYSCFLKFLGTDKIFIIEDDDTAGLRNKYLEIKKENYCIKFVFYNYIYDDTYDDHWARYRAFIKNYGPDPRSKIDNYDDKIRIINLFRSLKSLVKDEYYQMTIQEYLETLNYQKDEKIKKLKLKEIEE